METKWTPGPWYLDHCARCDVWQVHGPNGVDVLSTHWVGFGEDGDSYGAVDNEPTAHLIAAAPELYAALAQMVVQFAEIAGDCRDPAQALCERKAIEASEAALAKARGEA